MLIPLELHMFRLIGVGDRTVKRHYNDESRIPRVDRDKNLVTYELTPAARSIVESDKTPKHLNPAYSIDYIPGRGVCLNVPDHGFGRGIVRMLLGWKYIASAPQGEIADKVEALLRKSARGEWLRSRLYGSSSWMEAFSLQHEEDLHLAQLSFCQIEAKESRLPHIPIAPDPEPEETDY